MEFHFLKSQRVVAAVIPALLLLAGAMWLLTKTHREAASPPASNERLISIRAQGSADASSQRLTKWSQLAGRSKDSGEANDELRQLVATLDPSEILDAIKSLEKSEITDEADRAELTALIIRRWSEKDPAAATAWVMSLPPGAPRDLAVENVAIARANENLEEAAAWVKSMAPGPERNGAIFAVANEAVRMQPDESLRLAAELPQAAANDELIRRATMEWTSKDQTAALVWAKEIEDPEFRSQVLSGVTIAWAETDPAAAGNFAANELPAGRLQDDAVVAIIQRWAQQAPKDAAAWVARFPAGELRDAAVENLLAIWADADPAGSAKWREEFADRPSLGK